MNLVNPKVKYILHIMILEMNSNEVVEVAYSLQLPHRQFTENHN